MRPTTTLERSFPAGLDKMWSLLATRAGIESWRGPGGFAVRVRELDLRPGGAFRYDMVAVGAEQVAHMTAAGLPLETATHATFDRVEPYSFLTVRTRADFIPDVEPYDVTARYELRKSAPNVVDLILTIEAMHDAHWSEMHERGHAGELDKLAAALAT